MRAVSRFEWSYINERGVLSLFYKGTVGHLRHSLVCFWRVLASSYSYYLVFFLSQSHPNPINPCLGPVFHVCVCAEAIELVAVKKMFHLKVFSPHCLLFLFSCSTHSHTQLPRRRRPLPGNACRWKRTRPLPEGQRELGGQTPWKDVPGTDWEWEWKKWKGVYEEIRILEECRVFILWF